MSSDADFLLTVPIFSELDNEALSQIVKIGLRKKYSKDSMVLMEEEPGSALFIIISGSVKVSRTNNEGREVILNILTAGNFFGEMSLLDGLSGSSSVISIEETEMLVIERTQFVNLLKTEPELAISLIQELSHRLRDATMKIKSLFLKDAEGKVATVLLQLAYEDGKIKQGIVEIEKLPLQQNLANMAGTSRETVSRTLHGLVKKGLVELDGNRLKILDYEKFKEIYV